MAARRGMRSATRSGVRGVAGALAGRAGRSVRVLVGGLGTGLLAAGVFVLVAATAVSCLVGVGLLLALPMLRLVRALAERERRRLSRHGAALASPYQDLPNGIRAALADPATRRDLAWLPAHALVGVPLGLIGLLLPVLTVRDLSVPLWWPLAPPGMASTGLSVLVTVTSWPTALAAAAVGLGWLAVWLVLGPPLARLQSAPGRSLLRPHRDVDLSLRIAELTATRAAALDAHSAELRRIERALHDGTQNRLVGVTVLLGAARRALSRDPATADEVLERAQAAAESALAELRGVVRGILPPVLADRGLDGALAALVADSRVPCRLEFDAPGRCAASIEATTYFVVAEALTNVARHSGARRATVSVRRTGDRLRVRVTDDGTGGADQTAGSGLAGIRGRVAAHDGVLTVDSPPGGPTTLEAELPCGS
jgi:signal transduction histidine kinase